MIKSIIISACFIAIFCCCNDKKEKLFYYNNGVIKERRAFLSEKDTLSYLREVYFPNGILHFRGTIKNNKTEGNLYEYFQNNTLGVSTMFINGKKNGIQTFYDTNEIRIEQNFFIEDSLILVYKYFKQQGFHVYGLHNGKQILVGRIIYKNNGEINKDSSYYYTCSCKDTLYINKEYTCKLEVFNLSRGKQFIQLNLFDPFNAFTFPYGSFFQSDSLFLNFKFTPKKTGNYFIEGGINLTNDTTKQEKNFIFHKEFYVKEN